MLTITKRIWIGLIILSCLLFNNIAEASDIWRYLYLEESPEDQLNTLKFVEFTEEELKQDIDPPEFSTEVVAKSYRGFTPVENQDVLGVCQTFAVSSALEKAYNRSSNGDLLIISKAHFAMDLAEQFKGCKSGTSILNAMERAKDQGAYQQDKWSYLGKDGYIKQLCDQHKIDFDTRWEWDEDKTSREMERSRKGDVLNTYICLDKAPTPQFSELYAFSDIGKIYHRKTEEVRNNEKSPTDNDMKKIQRVVGKLNQYVVISVPVFWKEDGDDYGWETGKIKIPSSTKVNKSIHDSKGWHAITIVSWKGDVFVFKNSWDNTWGDLGYGIISYEYVKKYSRLAMYGRKT